MASLSKLCAVAGAGADEGADEDEGEGGGGGEGGGEDAERVRASAEECLALAAAHGALAGAGLARGPAVLPADELVRALAEAGRGALAERGYLRALQLAAAAPARQRLLLQVWCDAVLRDDWAPPAGPPASPQDELEGKTFYRLLLLVHATGGDLDILLPPLSDLAAAPELAAVTSQPHAWHLLRHAYHAVAPPSHGEAPPAHEEAPPPAPLHPEARDAGTLAC